MALKEGSRSAIANPFSVSSREGIGSCPELGLLSRNSSKQYVKMLPLVIFLPLYLDDLHFEEHGDVCIYIDISPTFDVKK